ncbi:Mitochondrial transcription termination factor 4 [Mactra antiquata]
MASLKLQTPCVLLHKLICHRFTLTRKLFKKSCDCRVFYDRSRRIGYTDCCEVRHPCNTWQIFVNRDPSFIVNAPNERWKLSRNYSTIVDNKLEPSSEDVNSSVESLVNDLMNKASDVDKMVITISKLVLYKQVRQLLNVGMLQEDIVQIFSLPENLMNLSHFVELMDVLCQYGFSMDDIVYLLKSSPEILKINKSHLVTLYEDLHNIGFPHDAINSMFVKCPALLTCDIKTKLPMIEELKLLFKKTDTYKLIERSPNVLFYDLSYIQERFNYVYHQMGITQPQMMYSKLFTYPMEHIITRHLFVVRAGYFKKLQKSKGQVDMNPKLDTIIDTTDDEFAEKFGNMTSLDYQTFKSLVVNDIVRVEEEDDE